MKKILYIMCLSITLVTTAQSTWQEIATPTNKNLNSIDFPTPLVGYIGGEDSLLLKTTDGGLTWDKVNFSGITFFSGGYDFMELDFVTAEIGFATIGPYTGAYKTTDGGLTWTQLGTSGSLCYNHGLYFLDQTYGFVGGAGCFQGENMDKFVSGTASPVTINTPALGNDMIVDIDFNLNSFASYGLAVSTGGRVLRTIDSGDTWDTIPTSLGNGVPLTSVTIVNDTLAYAGFDNGGSVLGLLISTDSGMTWTTDMNTATFHYSIFHDVYTTPLDKVYSGATSTTLNKGMIFESDDSGVWNYYEVAQPINCMTSYSDTIVWGVGDSGYVVTNLPSGQLSVSEFGKGDKLHIFPNPANNQFTIQLPSGDEGEPFNVEIYSLDGKRVQFVSNNATKISVSNLESGNYIVKFTSENKIWTSKLLKL
jgi:photosystem II stability/assembly factor-like uncharacterized protein